MGLWDEDCETPETEEEPTEDVSWDDEEFDDDNEVGQYLEDACWN